MRQLSYILLKQIAEHIHFLVILVLLGDTDCHLVQKISICFLLPTNAAQFRRRMAASTTPRVNVKSRLFLNLPIKVRHRMDTDYQNKHYNIDQKEEGTRDDQGRGGGTNFIFRIKEQDNTPNPSGT